MPVCSVQTQKDIYLFEVNCGLRINDSSRPMFSANMSSRQLHLYVGCFIARIPFFKDPHGCLIKVRQALMPIATIMLGCLLPAPRLAGHITAVVSMVKIVNISQHTMLLISMRYYHFLYIKPIPCLHSLDLQDGSVVMPTLSW